MKKESTILQLDVKDKQFTLKNKNDKVLESQVTEREKALDKYVRFFEHNLLAIDDIKDPNYVALEIVNDEGLTVSKGLQKQGFSNFKICHANLLEVLLENPAVLSKINLVHAVMPFDSVYPIIQAFSKIPEISEANTRVVLGAYDNYEELEHDQNKRALDSLMRDLDFCRYKGADYDGVSVRMICSTYQKNLRMRH